MLPVGAVALAVAIYIVESAVLPSVMFTALIVFSVGVLLSVISLIGCLGAASQSRFFLSLFHISTSLLSVIFFTAGVTVFVLRQELIDYLLKMWPRYRTVFPPLFIGRFDVAYYSMFVKTNLNLFGFGCFVFFLYLMIESCAGLSLKDQLAYGSGNVGRSS